MIPKLRWRALVWVCLLLVTAGTLAAGTRAATAPAPTTNHAWKKVSLLYLSDIKGKIEPCG